MFDAMFSGKPIPESALNDDRKNGDQGENTSIAEYVWLPFRFDGEMAYLDWLDEWRIEDYE